MIPKVWNFTNFSIAKGTDNPGVAHLKNFCSLFYLENLLNFSFAPFDVLSF